MPADVWDSGTAHWDALGVLWDNGVDTTPPTKPTALVATAISAHRIDLAWTAATDNTAVGSYEVYRDASLIDTIGNVTTYSDLTCDESTSYTYTLKAKDTSGNVSALSDPASATTPAADTTTDIDVTTTLATRITQRTARSIAAAATVTVGLVATKVKPITVVATLAAALVRRTAKAIAATTTVTPRILRGTTHRIAVTPTATVALVATFHASAEPDTTPPTPPNVLVATAITDTRIDLMWSGASDNIGVVGYEVYRNGDLIASSGASTYSDTSVMAATTYVYQVKALDLAGNASVLSVSASATTPAAAPVGSGWGAGPWGVMPWGGGGVTPPPGIQIAYRLVLATRGTTGLGTPIISDVLAAGVPIDSDSVGRWSRTLNAAGTLEFSLPIDACTPDDFAPGQRELHLYRDDGFGERLVWAGHLWTADISAPWVRFLGMGFYEALRHREMSDDFYDQHVEQRAIAWQLIDYTQNQPGGALGITRATAAGSPTTRTVLYCAEERQVIADAIEDLASADDGFDFDISPDKVWRTWTPERGTDLHTTVELDTTTTIVDLAYSVDATQVENDVAGIGAKGDCEPIHFVRSVDTDSRDNYGLMQGTVNRSDIKNDDVFITALAAERLALLKDARKQPTVRLFQGLGGPSPLSGDFDIGDTIAIRSGWGYASFYEKFRVMSYSVSFDRVGNEMLELVLDARGVLAPRVSTPKTIAATTTVSPAITESASNATPKAVAATTTGTVAVGHQAHKLIAITEVTGHTHTQQIDVGTVLQ